MSYTDLAPIAVFCYNRRDALIETVESLKKNFLAQESELFIFSDGPKAGQEKKVQEVREYIKTIEGFKSVEIYESSENRGLANSLINGITNIISKCGKVIVIEDDIITSPYFLTYMNDALEMYKDDNRVGSVAGYTYPLELSGELPQTYFIRNFECWGWGTWKRCWDLFEPDAQKLMDELKEKNLVSTYNYDDSHFCYDMLQEHIEGKINTWAMRFAASLLLADKLCLCPTKPLAKNIGFGKYGTHTKGRNKGAVVELDTEPFVLKRIEIEPNQEIWNALVKHYRKTSGRIKGNFIFKRERIGHERIVTILGFFKFSYYKK